MKIRAQNAQQQAVLEAAATGDLEALKRMDTDDDSHGKNNLICSSRCVSGCSALHWAAGANQVDVVRYLVSQRQNTISGGGLLNVNLPVAANRKAAGRTPLHYAARNGCLEAAMCLVQELGADCNAAAKHGVTPFQLALFQNQLRTASWLVSLVNDCSNTSIICQTNDFGCNALHWLAICPSSRAGPGGVDLIPTAEWLHRIQQLQNLSQQSGHSSSDRGATFIIDLFTATQKQGHRAFHKAAWLGHLELVRYLHERHDQWDDTPDDAGNYAADLAEMGGHCATADYLRHHCNSRLWAQRSCAILGMDSAADASDPVKVRRAYLKKARELHPDRRNDDVDTTTDAFDAIRKAYHHLTVEQGRGQQRNPAHSLKLMLQVGSIVGSDTSTADATSDDNNTPPGGGGGGDEDDDCFKARLIAVLLEYGDKGLDVSNLKKKWKQVWQTDFPVHRVCKGVSLTKWIRQHANDVIELRVDEKGCCRAHAKHCTRDTVAAIAALATATNS